MEKHIVIIDDDDALLSVMEFLLTEAGYRVTCISRITTIELLLTLKPDCFILDEQMPVVNGHILCMILNSKPETKDIPVILVSALDEIESYANLCEASAFLKKPFLNPDDLLNVVAKTIGAGVRKV
ncbi:response regulator [Mucilaginibacter sp. S1162]|uniref:Response regulator n=1 Tax=Mucilaginibacter humi TaxID=2732510 RepID=A0ABX1W5I2_9SPHI|nr:response regulator [Mucilaginibacter humi]NNU34878.1 response regulator [Mucilaginibacter humi]